MNQGLYHQIGELTKQLSRAQDLMSANDVTPRDRAIYQMHSETLVNELTAARYAAGSNEEMIRTLDKTLNDVRASGHQSRHRSLTITHLEDAIMRLTYELGDKPN